MFKTKGVSLITFPVYNKLTLVIEDNICITVNRNTAMYRYYRPTTHCSNHLEVSHIFVFMAVPYILHQKENVPRQYFPLRSYMPAMLFVLKNQLREEDFLILDLIFKKLSASSFPWKSAPI